MLSAIYSEENAMNLDSRIAWLKAGSLITIGFGLLIAAAAIPALNYPMALLGDLIFFPIDGAPTLAAPGERLLSAITGGVMTGWGAMMYLVATELLPKDPALGRRLILTSIVSWFVIDSSMSVAAGAPLNVVGNLGFLLVFVLPLKGLGQAEASSHAA